MKGTGLCLLGVELVQKHGRRWVIRATAAIEEVGRAGNR
jgi:hypothetical protein